MQTSTSTNEKKKQIIKKNSYTTNKTKIASWFLSQKNAKPQSDSAQVIVLFFGVRMQQKNNQNIFLTCA